MNLFQWMGRFSQVLELPLSIGWTPYTLKYMLVGLLLYGCGIALYYSSRENRRPGEEYGSAKWGNPKELNRKYMDHRHKDANIILTQRVRLGMDGYITQRNMNILVIAAPAAARPATFANRPLFGPIAPIWSPIPKGQVLKGTGDCFCLSAMKCGYSISSTPNSPTATIPSSMCGRKRCAVPHRQPHQEHYAPQRLQQ